MQYEYIKKLQQIKGYQCIAGGQLPRISSSICSSCDTNLMVSSKFPLSSMSLKVNIKNPYYLSENVVFMYMNNHAVK